MRKRPRGILFDFFNTIVRRVRFDPDEGFRALLELAQGAHSLSLREVLERNALLGEQLNPLLDASDIWSTSHQYHRLLFDGLGAQFVVSPQELEQVFFEASMTFEPVDGIQECLVMLRERGLRLGVVSNHSCTGDTLRSALDRLNIADPFDFVVSSADYGVGKPHPLIFDTAVAKLGVEHRETWFVGDNLSHDIAGANEAGLFSVWYNPARHTSNSIEPNVMVVNWAELLNLLD